MEQRRLLTADPLFVGAVYIEEDLGSDDQGDTFAVSFRGGADHTELTRLEIHGDQNAFGFSVGDVFFDNAESGFGADNAADFRIVSLNATSSTASVSVSVLDGGSLLVLEFEDFRAGDQLVFSIDVDEVEFYDPAESDPALINDGFDPITSGIEFQGSRLNGNFRCTAFL